MKFKKKEKKTTSAPNGNSTHEKLVYLVSHELLGTTFSLL